MGDGRRVLQLLGPSTGGIRRHVAHLSGALVARGWAVTVAGPAGVMDGLGPSVSLGPLGRVVVVPVAMAPGAVVGGRRALAGVLDDVAVVHAHGLKAGWLAASLRGRPPLVVSVHNLVQGDSVPSRALRVLEGRLAARADRVVATSGEVARRYTGLPGADRVVVVPPGGPPPRPRRPPEQVRADLGLSPGERLLVTAARLHPQKGLDVLLVALDRLRHRVGAVRAVVLGEGPLEDDLRRQAAQLGLDGIVVFGGARPEVADELAAADVVVVSSRWESGPLVVFEALALGRPVVTTAVGTAPDVVLDGVTGRLVAPGDPAALAAALEDVLGDPVRAAAMGEAGRRLVGERLDPERLVDRMEGLYRELVGGA